TGRPCGSTATMPCCCADTPTPSRFPRERTPASSQAQRSASTHARGSIAVPSGCGAVADATVRPVPTSTTRTLQDCVEESTPTTTPLTSQLLRQRPPVRVTVCGNGRTPFRYPARRYAPPGEPLGRQP